VYRIVARTEEGKTTAGRDVPVWPKSHAGRYGHGADPPSYLIADRHRAQLRGEWLCWWQRYTRWSWSIRTPYWN